MMVSASLDFHTLVYSLSHGCLLTYLFFSQEKKADECLINEARVFDQ